MELVQTTNELCLGQYKSRKSANGADEFYAHRVDSQLETERAIIDWLWWSSKSVVVGRLRRANRDHQQGDGDDEIVVV